MAIFDLKDEDDVQGFSSPDLKKRHTKALDGFKLSASFFTEQRRREVEDLKFIDFNEQWDPTVKTQRAGNQAVNGLPPTPPRPMITINQLRGPCQQVANARRAARLALEFAPKGAGSSDDVAEVFEDIVRAAQAESRAAIARNWAADRAEKAGLGWYRIDKDYCETPEDDKAAWNDQDLAWCRILNQASVYPDPHAQEPDFSDGRRWFVTEDLPLEVYKDRYPDSTLAAYDNGELSAIGNQQPKWVFTSSNGSDGEESQTVRIAEVWEVVETERTLVMLEDGSASYDDEIPKGQRKAEGPMARSRKKRERKIFWSKINAVEYLEEPVEWDGAYVPLIPCVGEESNVDGERRWQGIVRPGREAAISYNVMRSAQVEAIASASKAPYIGFARTIGQFMEWWKQSAIRNFPILPIEEAYDKDGKLLPPPQRNPAQIDISAMTIAAQAAKDDVHTTTGVPPAALGALDPHDRSGKAIQALQSQAEVGTSGYMDNLVNITLAYEGKVVRDLIPRLFDRPGRIVPAVGVDEKRRLVMLNAPYVSDADGMPHMLPGWQEGQPVPKQIQGPNGPLEVKYYNLKAGQYSVAPVAGKSYNTRREEASAAIGNVLQSVPPEMAMAIAPAWLEEQDYPGAKKIAEIAKKALPPQLAAAYQDDRTAPDAEKQAMQQKIQQLSQQLEMQGAKEQAKQQGELQKVQIQEQAETQRSQQTDAVSLQKAEIQATATMSAAQAKVDAENFRSYVDAMESRLAKSLDLHLAHVTQLMQQTHEARTQATEHAHEKDMAAINAQVASQQAEQQAALNPPQAEA